MKKKVIKANKRDTLDGKVQIPRALNYIRDSQNYIYFVIGVFILSGLIGFFFAENLVFLNDIIRDLLLKTQDLNGLEMIFFILQNNMIASLYAFIGGAILGIFPVVSAFVNGLLIGYVLNLSWNLSGISDFWRLLPHGIFELPAVFISMGLGVKLGFSFFAKDKIGTFRERLYESLNVFLFVVVPLLIIAAIIEGILIALF